MKTEITIAPKQSMYNIRTEHLELLQLIEEGEGELTPEIEHALQLTEQEFNEKAISYGFVIKSFDDTSELIDKEIKRLQALKERSEKRYQLFKEALDHAMRQFGVEKITTPTLTISYRKSKSIEITDEKLIPDVFKIAKEPVVSKTLIKVALDEGKAVPGAELVEKKNLQIK